MVVDLPPTPLRAMLRAAALCQPPIFPPPQMPTPLNLLNKTPLRLPRIQLRAMLSNHRGSNSSRLSNRKVSNSNRVSNRTRDNEGSEGRVGQEGILKGRGAKISICRNWAIWVICNSWDCQLIFKICFSRDPFRWCPR